MSEVIGIILGLFKFWDEVVWFIKLVQGTPEQHQQAILDKVKGVFDETSSDHLSRPKWDN